MPATILDATYRKAKENLLKRHAVAQKEERGKIKRQLLLLELVYYKNLNIKQLAVRLGLSNKEVQKEIEDLLAQGNTFGT